MIIVSFNIRGLGGAPKSLSLKKLFCNIRIGIVLIQETMCEGVKACDVFLKFLPRWEVSVIDAMGLCGGLLAA